MSLNILSTPLTYLRKIAKLIIYFFTVISQPMTYEHAIAYLKKIIATEKDLGVIGNYFFDKLGNNPDFFHASKRIRTELEFFHALLNPLIEKANGKGVHIIRSVLMIIEPHDLIHGLAHLSSGGALVFFFFRDIQTGMAVLYLLPEQEEMTCFRLTAFLSKEKPEGIPINPGALNPTEH